MNNNEIFYIKTGSLYTIIKSLPASVLMDAVTIEIRRISDNYTWNFSSLAFASGTHSGSMSFVHGILWSNSFTPNQNDTHLVTITNSTKDVVFTMILISVEAVVSNINIGSLFPIVYGIPESVSTDTVTIEIRRASDNYTWNFSSLEFAAAAVSGAMTFVNGIAWRQSFTPPTEDTYIITIEDTTLDVVHCFAIEAVPEVTTTPTPSATITPGTNSFCTYAEAVAYFATRLSSAAWTAASTAEKTAAIITAYNQLVGCDLYDFPISVSDYTAAIRNAQCEMALFLLIHLSDMDSRAGLQAQGVLKAGIIQEEYDPAAMGKPMIPANVRALLSDLESEENFFAVDVTRDDDQDV